MLAFCGACCQTDSLKYFSVLYILKVRIAETLKEINFRMARRCIAARDNMRIEIRRGADGRAVIVSFDTRSERFANAAERNKFFRGLYGWEQVVPHERKSYRYHRPGLLDDVPHIKISDSVFMVSAGMISRVLEYFRQWQEKVEFEVMEVLLENQRLARELCRPNEMAFGRKRKVEIEEG